ncbi:MAG: ABC transporter permease [Phycisphaerales bacterium]|nr:ABC transporter permease [Phycisphaerales bacterium]
MAGEAGGDNFVIGVLGFIGKRALSMLDQIGTSMWLLMEAVTWVVRSMTHRKVRIGRRAIVSQMVRVGVRSVFIVGLVSGCVGFILALQMSPPLDDFGQKDKVANITGVAVLRELGPLIAAIVLTGFAGAAIAAEIGTMVVGEEIEALEAHALNPVRFLVVPRVIATVVSMTCLAVFSDWMAISAGYLVGVYALGIEGEVYIQNTLDQVEMVDFLTGIGKATVFGLLIGLISCMNGLRVTGGAAGVGNATTGTVVQSIVAIIIADLVFTGIFYSLGWV